MQWRLLVKIAFSYVMVSLIAVATVACGLGGRRNRINRRYSRKTAIDFFGYESCGL